jgi:hypothetical protein
VNIANPDINVWLRMLNAREQYQSKIVAYYGLITPNDPRRLDFISLNNISDSSPGSILEGAEAFHIKGDDHGLLLAGNIAIDYGMKHVYNFNDGLVPIESAAFDGKTIQKSVACLGFDHADLKDGGAKLLDKSGETLFEAIANDLGVTSFDGWLQDDKKPSLLLFFNSLTGGYKLVQCGSGGFAVEGTGAKITKNGCVIVFHAVGPNFSVSAHFNKCQRTGTAAGVIAGRGSFTISDSDTTNNTCGCR